jgi:hypothetical protein
LGVSRTTASIHDALMTRLTPDRSYRIDAAARARLHPGVDAEALERLLQHFPAESRASHLEMFSTRHVVVNTDDRAPDVTVLTRISDPGMQLLLEEVWQPFWAPFSDAELEREVGGPPGRGLARRCRDQQRRV